MSIEDTLIRIAVALEAIAATPGTVVAADPGVTVTKNVVVKVEKPKKEVAKAEPASVVVNDDLERTKGGIKALLEANLRGEAMELLKAHGAASASSLAAKGTAAVDAFLTAADELIAQS